MCVAVKLYSYLRLNYPGYPPGVGIIVNVDNPAGLIPIHEVIESIGINVDDVRFACVNGLSVPLNSSVKSGDELGLFPPSPSGG